MSKKPKSVETAKSEPEQANVTTFCIRLNDVQRGQLVEAARLKHWSPTQFVRVATLERAVEVTNTGVPRAFDYKGLAAELAYRWFAPRTVEYLPSRDDLEALSREEEPFPFTVPVPPLPLGDLFRLEKAVNEGGSEFLRLLFEFAQGLMAAQRRDLPEPINPKSIIGNGD